MTESGLTSSSEKKTVLITGASGYIGGRLLPLLEGHDYSVRCLVRSPKSFPHSSKTREVIKGDVLDKRTLKKALKGVDAAFYLVNSIGISRSQEESERTSAANFGQIASESNVKKIIYLSALGTSYEPLPMRPSKSLEVGHILRTTAAHVQVIEFRASTIIGSGSLPFEVIGSLAEKFQILPAPKWLYTKIQPLSISDLLKYLLQGLELKIEGNQIFEIGGKDRTSLAKLIEEYARQKNLKCNLLPLPGFFPIASILCLGLLTSLYMRIAKSFVITASTPSIVHDPLAGNIFPINPAGVKEIIASAAKYEDNSCPETRWMDSVSSSIMNKERKSKIYGGKIINTETAFVNVLPLKAFSPIQKIGGVQGWYFLNFIWKARGVVDLFFGGIGMRRGRRSHEQLRIGDVIDSWRVDYFEPHRRLRLLSEMKSPGKVWLDFIVEPVEKGSKITQKTIFIPAGISGILYWYLLYPIHKIVFAGLLRKIAKEAEK